MPDDALREMVQTGALLPTDLVRNGLTGEWQPAANIPGLFANSDSSSADNDYPGSVTAPANQDLIAAWKATRPPMTEEMGLLSLASEIDAPAPLVEVVPPTVPESLITEHEPESRTPTEPHARIELPSLMSQIATNRPKRETVRQRWQRWRRSLPTWPFGVAAVVLLVAAVWFWPRSSHHVYQRFVSIWNELKERRDDFKNNDEFEQFVEQAKLEIANWVAWLEPKASAEQREKQLLLFVGRDCLSPMLQQPRTKNSRHERQLKVWLQELEETYNPPANPTPRAAFIGQNSSKAQDAAATAKRDGDRDPLVESTPIKGPRLNPKPPGP